MPRGRDEKQSTAAIRAAVEKVSQEERRQQRGGLDLERAVLSDLDFLGLQVPEKRVFLHPWLTEQSIILGSGYRGIGKTWFAIGVINAVTAGQPFGPWEAPNPAPCLLIDGEMPVQDIKERMAGMSLGLERKAPLFIYSDAYANILGLPRAHLGNKDWRTALKEILILKKVKLLVLDNLASLSPGLDENAKQDWDPINQWLLELRFAGVSTLMLHHVNKNGQQRGISSREDNIDHSIILKSPPNYSTEQGCRFVVEFTKSRVRSADKHLVAEVEFALQEVDGRPIWTWNAVKRAARDEVLRNLDAGIKQSDICTLLSLSKGHVSRIKAQAIKDGWLDNKCKLTQRGFQAIL